MSTETASVTPLRERFLAAGMRVLARDGYVGFKQAAICAETSLTTGAFYHSFPNWKTYETALIAYWRSEATERLVESLQAIPSAQSRIDAAITVALNLPHKTEAAIRVWAAQDTAVRDALREVDARRHTAITEVYIEFGASAELANHLAATAIMLLIGYENSDMPLKTFEWSMRRIAEDAVTAVTKSTG